MHDDQGINSVGEALLFPFVAPLVLLWILPGLARKAWRRRQDARRAALEKAAQVIAAPPARKAPRKAKRKADEVEHKAPRKAPRKVKCKAKYGTVNYWLGRLDKERPDLARLVRKGEISANTGAIRAGFRKSPVRLVSARA